METILWQRDGKGCSRLEGLGDWLSSSHICLAVLFLFMLLGCFYERWARHGCWVYWRTEGQNLSGMVHVAVCAIAAGQHAASPASFYSVNKGKRGGRKKLGSWSVTWELLAHVVSPFILQTLLSGGEPWRGSDTGCASAVGSVCTGLTWLVNGAHCGRMECVSLSFLLHS